MALPARALSLAVGASKPAPARMPDPKPVPVTVIITEPTEPKKSYQVWAEQPEVLANFPANIRWMVATFGPDG